MADFRGLKFEGLLFSCAVFFSSVFVLCRVLAFFVGRWLDACLRFNKRLKDCHLYTVGDSWNTGIVDRIRDFLIKVKRLFSTLEIRSVTSKFSPPHHINTVPFL